MIHIVCPHCQRLLQAADTQAGNFIPCPGCNNLVPLPGQGQSGKSLKRLWVIAYGGAACAFLAMAAVFAWGFFGTDIKVTTAQMKIREITQACKQYCIDHSGQFPANLDELVTKDEAGRGPYLKRETIMDPWGKPYQYDPDGSNRHSVSALVQIPDVYCTLPDGRLIGNWDSKGK